MRFILSLLALVTIAAEPAAAGRLRLIPLVTITYGPPAIAGSHDATMLFNERYAFAGTDAGLFRLPVLLNAPPERIAFPSTPVTGLARRDGVLYATLDGRQPAGSGATANSLLRSLDDGATWTPIDAELRECLGGICEFLVSSEIVVAGDRIFLNAGGNVIVSGDEGASWTVLHGLTSTGKPQAQACYDPAFALVGQRLLIGGECPLDFAFLRGGMLRPDLLGWQEEPRPATTPVLENRNVQFIRQRAGSSLVYAGIEGGLLRSADAGASYEFVLRYEMEAAKYPYINDILFPSRHPSVILISGFDKAKGGPFLAVSSDEGLTWKDESALLPGGGLSHWSVAFLEEDPLGRMILGVEDDQSGSLYISELRLSGSERRRAVGR